MSCKSALTVFSKRKISALLMVAFIMLSVLLVSCKKEPGPDENAVSTTETVQETTTEVTTEATTVEITTDSSVAGTTQPVTTAASVFSEADQLYFKDTVFIGDSITTGIELYGVTKDATVLADKGLNTTTVMKYIGDVGRIKPKYIYVMLGSNDIGFANMTPDKLIPNYDKFVKGIKEASPESIIYLQSVFPVTKKFEAARPAYTNEIIDSYNERIRQMAADNNVLYLNVAEVLKDANNDLRPEISPGEGMHIEKKGYYIWLEYVLNHRATEG